MKPKKINTIVVSEEKVNHCIFTKKRKDLMLDGAASYSFSYDNFDDFSHIVNEIKNNAGKNKYLYIDIIDREIIKNVYRLPKDNSNIKSQIYNNMKDDFDISLSEYYIDFIVNEGENANMVFASAIPRNLCDKIMDEFTEKGFKALGMETDYNSLRRVAANAIEGKMFLHMHVRNSESVLYIADDNLSYVEREINIGFEEIIKNVASAGGVSTEEARITVLEFGLQSSFDSDEDENKFNTISEAVDRISVEIQRTMDYYFQIHKTGGVEMILITGEILNIKEYKKYLQNLFNIETAAYEAANEITVNINNDIDLNDVGNLTESIGLGLKII